MTRARWGTISIAVLALGIAACDDDPLPIGPPAPAERGWAAVRNPVLTYPDAAVKDAFAIRRGDTWHFGFSYIRDDPFRFRLGFSATPDFVSFGPLEVIDQPEVGGLASPDVSTAPDGTFVVTYNSHTRDVGESANKLYLRTSADLRTWSGPRRIVIEGADGADDRLIDAAMVFADEGSFLFFKREQIANVAVSSTRSPDGPWKLLGPIEPKDMENVQVLRIDGTWHLLATSTPLLHRPVLHRLEGDPKKPESWRTWTRVRELEIPEQPWNTGDPLTYERANAGYLIDARAIDGFFLLLYAGSTEVLSYQSRGHAKLGLARSRDLVTWEPATAR